MVDDNLVSTVGAEGGLYGRGNGPACIDISKDSTIFGVVAIQVRTVSKLRCFCGCCRLKIRGGGGAQKAEHENLLSDSWKRTCCNPA